MEKDVNKDQMKDHNNDQKTYYYVDSPIGEIGIAEDGKGISDLFFGRKSGQAAVKEEGTPLLLKAAGQLEEFFKSKRQVFDLPISLCGTDFQMAVWDALQSIPYGETRSYKQIAEQIGKPKAYRAVGMANNRNPVSIIIPCHRVIGHDGSLTGYGGGVTLKDYLLRLEARYVVDKRLNILDMIDDDSQAKSLDDVDEDKW
jgi:methylated-DNA-[protein]-cysteine S-methyltransferase